MSRADAKGMTEPVLRQVFKADTKTLPSYTGVEAPGGGYMLMRVTRVVEPEKIDSGAAESIQRWSGADAR